ncbi:MAG: hypothetical protein LBG72_00450 [Spirochaetaceae bacterium]|jgi:hypothetical protein|nr:hypothetical protein [Spirochaetaceae bacterium]
MGKQDETIQLLRRMANGIDKLVASTTKPISAGKKVIEIITLAATAAGIMSGIDLLKHWLGG